MPKLKSFSRFFRINDLILYNRGCGKLLAIYTITANHCTITIFPGKPEPKRQILNCKYIDEP